MLSGRGTAGAGLSSTGIWEVCAVRRISRTVGSGISSWRTRREGIGLLPREEGEEKELGSREWFAPGEKRIRFSPVLDSTRITATPVDVPGMVLIEEVSMREDWREEIRVGPTGLRVSRCLLVGYNDFKYSM
jgi:hypothetical protein